MGVQGWGDSQVGVLKSATFTLGGSGSIDFLIGGGNDINHLYVALVQASDGTELIKATGNSNEAYSRITWNAAAYIGKECYIKIVDSATGGFGHINVDDVNVPVSSGAADTEAPAAPMNLAATGTTKDSVSLGWTISTDNIGVTGYLVYRNGVQVATSTTATYTDSGLTTNTPYVYTVKAKDAAGNISAASNSVTATTQAAQETGSLTNHDFEGGNLSGWIIVSGNAFSDADVAADTSWGWGGPFNQSGAYHLWGFKDGGDSLVGVLKSVSFTLGGNGTIDFLIGGGNDINNLYIALVRASDGTELLKATGNSDEAYSRITWEAASFVGTDCYIKIVDNATGGFGHINVDDVNVPVLVN